VARTAKRTIWPVLVEVVLLNMLFGLAFQTLPQVAGVATPDALAYAGEGCVPQGVREYRDTAMRLLATETTGGLFGGVASVVFGLLLLSAANTAVVAMISVLYAMAQDHELPRPLTRLNYSGVPWVSLVVSVALPIVVLALERDVDALAKLYAIGVCGAVTTNVFSCVLNRGLALSRFERIGMSAVGLVMFAVTATIVATQLAATAFAGALIGAVLGVRQALAYQRAAGPPPLPVPVAGWLAEIERAPAEIVPGRPRIMLAARGRYQAEFAVDLARRRGAILFALYVRTLRVIDIAPGTVPRVQDDPQALEALGTVAVLAHRYGVPFVPIYVASPDIGEEILDYTVTFGCDTLIMGKSRRSLFARRVAGDVIARVAQHLPSEVALITRDPTPHPMEPAAGETATDRHG
jgi:nucleotide-binding universal stress UspA family protein